MLFPNEVPLYLAARKMRKAALISNFVDRESKRPALGPNDFVPLKMIDLPETEDIDSPRKRKSRFAVQTLILGFPFLLHSLY